MIDLIDEVLSWPNKIDIYFYAPGAGGEFFTALCALSHIPTKHILTIKNFKKTERITGKITFKSQNYFDYEDIFIDELGYDMFKYSKFMVDPNTRINYYKMVLAHSFLNVDKKYLENFTDISGGKKNLSRKKEILKNTNIVLCTHWFDVLREYYANAKNLQNKTFGIPLFEKQKYWSVINLDPQTDKGKNLVHKYQSDFHNIKNIDISNIVIDHPAFKNIKLKFPFMDYMVDANFNAVKDYLENRYGPDLDFDFIDKALINYKKIRINPYL
jgi:hypothetical protein